MKALIDGGARGGAQDNVAAVVIACEETEVVPQAAALGAPARASSAAAAARRPMGSAPEIIIVGVETRVVPSDSATAGLLDALGRFARLRQPSVPEVRAAQAARCHDCGQPLEAGA